MWIKILSWINNRVKNTDRFATPIYLNYKGNSTYKTTIGGILSIIISIILIIYSIILFIKIVNKDGSVINSVTKTNYLLYNSRSYNLIDYKFLFGIYSVNQDYSTLLDPSYIKFIIIMLLQIIISNAK